MLWSHGRVCLPVNMPKMSVHQLTLSKIWCHTCKHIPDVSLCSHLRGCYIAS